MADLLRGGGPDVDRGLQTQPGREGEGVPDVTDLARSDADRGQGRDPVVDGGSHEPGLERSHESRAVGHPRRVGREVGVVRETR